MEEKPLPIILSKSVGAIIVNRRQHTLVVFQARNKYWEFPKGKVEKGETEMQTLQRELFEETGIRHFYVFSHFRKMLTYDFCYKGKRIRRKVAYYLIATTDRVRISREHMQYAWLSLPRAAARVKHQSQKDLVRAAMDYLAQHGER